MSKKCKAYSVSKLGLEPADNRKAFYAGWNAALAEQPEQQRPQNCGAGYCSCIECPYEQPAQQQEPVATFKWLPEGATHLGHISVRVCAGGSLAMNTHAFKYDNGVLKVYVTDNDNEYPGWRDAKNVFFHLNFPVIPLYTSPPASNDQRRTAGAPAPVQR